MGNSNTVPVVSQVKSLVQWVGGDSAGALATQQEFAYNNTFPVISQIASAGYAIGGDYGRAEDLQKRFADDMLNVIDSIPVAGHVKGAVHYGLGEKEEGDKAMKAASRSTGVVIGGVTGFAVGGPAGAVVGGIAGGAAMDGAITGSEMLIYGDDAKPHGYIKVGDDIVQAVGGKKNISVDEGFDMAMVPISDGLTGYAAGKIGGKPISFGSGARGKPVVVAGESGGAIAAKELELAKPKFGLDKAALDNRANQLNPNHPPSGPGRPAGYRGTATKFDVDNHANQLNPNNPLYQQG